MDMTATRGVASNARPPTRVLMERPWTRVRVRDGTVWFYRRKLDCGDGGGSGGGERADRTTLGGYFVESNVEFRTIRLRFLNQSVLTWPENIETRAIRFTRTRERHALLVKQLPRYIAMPPTRSEYYSFPLKKK